MNTLRLIACWTLLLMATGARAEAQTWPNEMWVNPGVGVGPPTDLRDYFDGWASEAFLGVLQDVVPVIDGPSPYSDLFTRLDFRVTEPLRGSAAAGSTVSVYKYGGTYLKLSDGTFVAHGLAEGLEEAGIGRTYFVGASLHRNRLQLAGLASLIRITKNDARSPSANPYWVDAVIAQGRSLLLTTNQGRPHTRRDAFLTAIRQAVRAQ